MLVSVGCDWEVVEDFPDGRQIRMTEVTNEHRVIGQLIDLGNGMFQASYIDLDGEVQDVLAPDILAAVQAIAQEAIERERILH